MSALIVADREPQYSPHSRRTPPHPISPEIAAMVAEARRLAAAGEMPEGVTDMMPRVREAARRRRAAGEARPRRRARPRRANGLYDRRLREIRAHRRYRRLRAVRPASAPRRAQGRARRAPARRTAATSGSSGDDGDDGGGGDGPPLVPAVDHVLGLPAAMAPEREQGWDEAEAVLKRAALFLDEARRAKR